ncbi:MAG: hypothetical protein NZ870_00765, partial [bacterium]|nr:hypothetical protein [bacterium]
MIKYRRRIARIRAIKGLYLYEKSKEFAESINTAVKRLPKDVKEFSIELYKGVIEKMKEIDEVIKNVVENYSLERIYSID